MFSSPLIYFTDAVVRAPTIGCMLMCLSAALVGVIVFLRKQSLVGESLSHAAYPGAVLGVMTAGLLSIPDDLEARVLMLILSGAFITAFAGLASIVFLERKLKVRSDSALCFVLSAFFGAGITIASQVQFSFTSFYRQIQAYLMGQAATMTDVHILIYGILSLFVIVVIILFYKELQVMAFDRQYAKSLGIQAKKIDLLVFVLIVLAVVIGIRSVGVVLMSAMLIAPPAAARQYTNKLSIMFLLAGIFGLISGFFGNYFSVEISKALTQESSGSRITFPTGPMIVIVASSICLLSLMFAPKRGLLLRLTRVIRFRYQCICENLLKAIWRFGPEKTVSFDEIIKHQSASPWYLRFVLSRLVGNGWVEELPGGEYRLSAEGELWASKIVRMHRLWEVYLVDYLGVGVERVHRSAEEMEHILTPELERELTLLLKDPKQDPHRQPIPPIEGV